VAILKTQGKEEKTMRKNVLLKAAFLAASLLILNAGTFAQDARSVIYGNNQFAFDLYAKYKTKDGNIFFSPYSISSALAMTYEGARGKTADEMQAVLHFPKDDAIRRESFLTINNQINKQDKKYQLRTANALWAQKDYKFKPDYFAMVEKYYAGKATNLDFINDTEKSRVKINTWVEEQTNNKIKDLLTKGIINSSTRLVLTNAIYFKGLWLDQFNKKNTQEKDFKVDQNNTVKVQMMSSTGEKAKFNYSETEKVQILELPYEGNELSMLILLPKKDDLQAAEEYLVPEKLVAAAKGLRKKRVDIYVPQFKFETKYFMAEDLKGMGMLAAFTPGSADFSGMTGTKELNIAHVIHQAFVEVNEEGTEAAAATAVVMTFGAMAPETPKIFNADRPFIFFIQERSTNNILFIGRVKNPAKP
jgi:serpin B